MIAFVICIVFPKQDHNLQTTHQSLKKLFNLSIPCDTKQEENELYQKSDHET